MGPDIGTQQIKISFCMFCATGNSVGCAILSRYPFWDSHSKRYANPEQWGHRALVTQTLFCNENIKYVHETLALAKSGRCLLLESSAKPGWQSPLIIKQVLIFLPWIINESPKEGWLSHCGVGEVNSIPDCLASSKHHPWAISKPCLPPLSYTVLRTHSIVPY